MSEHTNSKASLECRFSNPNDTGVNPQHLTIKTSPTTTGPILLANKSDKPRYLTGLHQIKKKQFLFSELFKKPTVKIVSGLRVINKNFIELDFVSSTPRGSKLNFFFI